MVLEHAVPRVARHVHCFTALLTRDELFFILVRGALAAQVRPAVVVCGASNANQGATAGASGAFSLVPIVQIPVVPHCPPCAISYRRSWQRCWRGQRVVPPLFRGWVLPLLPGVAL